MKRSLLVVSSERFSLDAMTLLPTEFSELPPLENAFKMTAVDCEKLEKSVGPATVDGVKLSTPAAMRCWLPFGSDVVEI